MASEQMVACPDLIEPNSSTPSRILTRNSSDPSRRLTRNASTPSRRLTRKVSDVPTPEPPQKRRCLSEETVTAPSIIGRESERKEVDTFLQRSLGRVPGADRCLYVSGGPGTGKTCSVKACTATWISSNIEITVLEVNCMNLGQHTAMALLGRLTSLAGGTLLTMGKRRAAMAAWDTVQADNAAPPPGKRSVPGLQSALVNSLVQLGGPVIIIVDEIDQLVQRRRSSLVGTGALEALTTLPDVDGAPPIAIIAIANAVDLLVRAVAPPGWSSLLFVPYTARELGTIVRARIAANGETVKNAICPVALEMRIRQVAKQSGDCRKALSLCEQLAFEAARIVEEPQLAKDTPRKVVGKTTKYDPLQSIEKLPMDHQILLCAFVTSQSESVPINVICTRLKEYCTALHQPQSMASKRQVFSILDHLEQRGLVSVRNAKSGALARHGDGVAELSVCREAVQERVLAATPALAKCLP